MRVLGVLAGRELKDGLRNRWVLAVTLLLAALALALSFLGSAPVGQVGASPLEIVVVSLASLSILLLPLIALLLSFDSIVGESERGTLLLLLAGPVLRWQVLVGKFLGQVAILAVATVMGYGVAAAAVALRSGVPSAEAAAAFATLIGSSVLLGAAFASMGLLVSVLVRERQTAAGAALGLWLMFAVLYDLALLGVLVADAGRHVTPGVLTSLLLMNPADAFRLLNLTGFGGVQALSGMAGLAGDVSPPLAGMMVLGAVDSVALVTRVAGVRAEGTVKTRHGLALVLLLLAACDDSRRLRRRLPKSPERPPGTTAECWWPSMRVPRARSSSRAQSALLVHLGTRRLDLHPHAGGAARHLGGLRHRHGQGCELGEAGPRYLDRGTSGVVRARQRSPRRHGRRQGHPLRPPGQGCGLRQRTWRHGETFQRRARSYLFDQVLPTRPQTRGRAC